jgi:hypothetical protein
MVDPKIKTDFRPVLRRILLLSSESVKASVLSQFNSRNSLIAEMHLGWRSIGQRLMHPLRVVELEIAIDADSGLSRRRIPFNIYISQRRAPGHGPDAHLLRA